MPTYYPGMPKEYTFQQIFNNAVIGDKDANGNLILSTSSAAAVGSASGGPRNGLPPSAMKKGKFSSSSFVDPNETLQQAIDKAPASNTLVQNITTGITDHGSGVYSIALAAKPENVYVDANYLSENAGAFVGTVLQDPEGFLTGSASFWKYDTSTSRLIVYDAGRTAPKITLVKFHAVVCTTKASYDACALRPGIFVVGMGRGVSEIRPVTSKIDNGYEYTVLAAEYSGLVDIDVVRPRSISNPGPVLTNTNTSGLILPTNVNCDQFYFEGGRIYSEANTTVGSEAYNVSIMFGSAGIYRAKNVNFVRARIEALGRTYVWETGSGLFWGRVILQECEIIGDPYIDGLANTFYFVNCKVTNINSADTIRANQFIAGKNFYANLGGAQGFSAEDLDGLTAMVFINTPIYGASRNDPSEAMSFFGSVGGLLSAQRARFVFRNSPIVGFDNIVKNASGATGAHPDKANQWESEGYQPIPIRLTTTYSDTQATPKWSKIIADTTRSSTTAAAGLNFGIIQIKYEDLVKRKTCRARVRGKFAANANTKTLKVQTGVNAAISPAMTLTDVSGGTFSSTYNGLPFEYNATVSLSGTTVLVSGSMVIGGTATPFSFISETAIAAGQYFKIVLNAVATTAAADIVISYQQVEVDG